jgi:hypothetical protein
VWVSTKGNFDVVIRGNFAVATAVLTNTSMKIFAVVTLKLHSSNFLLEDVTVALLATQLTRSSGSDVFSFEGDVYILIKGFSCRSILIIPSKGKHHLG